jgi:cyanophycinase-like exopeptidase
MSRIKPLYLLSGDSYHHRKTRDPLIREMFRETGKPHPAVAYIGTASGDDPAFFGILRSLFLRSGAGSVELVPLSTSDADLADSLAQIESADVIFLSEGDVDMGMRVLNDQGIPPILRQRYQDGVVFSGFSAGSILLSRQWVRWTDPDDDASAEPFDCLGIAPLVCDTHGEAFGWEELKTLLRLRQTPGEIGYGIPTSMGLRVFADGRIEAIGGIVHRYTFRDRRVDNIGDISPAFIVHPSEYEYQI